MFHCGVRRMGDVGRMTERMFGPRPQTSERKLANCSSAELGGWVGVVVWCVWGGVSMQMEPAPWSAAKQHGSRMQREKGKIIIILA